MIERCFACPIVPLRRTTSLHQRLYCVTFCATNSHPTYAYVANDPINLLDPSGLAWYEYFDWVDPVGNFFMGAADTVTMGATGWIRDKAGLSDQVNPCSSAYRYGSHAALVAEFALGAAALMKGAAKFAARRAARGGVNLASPQRTRHILYGDATGGGHKFGLSRLFNGKSKFPATWSDSRIMNAVSEVAASPTSTWVQQTGRAGASLTRRGVPVKFKVEGVYDGVKIRAIVQGDDIITAFPIK